MRHRTLPFRPQFLGSLANHRAEAEWYERATELDPGHRPAWAALALLHERQGRAAAAEMARGHAR